MMTPAQKKYVHAAVVALVSVMTDVGAQLASGQLNVTRAVAVGLIVGSLGRIAGAVLAKLATEAVLDPSASTDDEEPK